MLPASRVFFIFDILAAVVRIYSPLTNGAGITRLDNTLAAAGKLRRQQQQSLPASRVSFMFDILAAVVRIYSPLTNGAGITRLDNTRAAAGKLRRQQQQSRITH